MNELALLRRRAYYRILGCDSYLRRRLDSFMQERAISREGARFYSHLLPSLDRGSWAGNNVGGDGWLAVGDAAGLVDPITGEGIYYGIR